MGYTCRTVSVGFLDPGSTPGTSTLNLIKRPPTNNQIRASKVRVIDETGKQLGILTLSEALQIAEERSLDLIQVTERVEPPVCKIADHGKYLYMEEKKERKSRRLIGRQLKQIRISFRISSHDLETKAKLIEKFLKHGNKVRIEMRLRGREKALSRFAQEKMNNFLEMLRGLCPIKIEKELRKEPRGLTIIIAKQ